jgi:stearoyl-CoA desaturase (delta-9 desaturase)
MAHLMGRRRFRTEDDSRNSFILAIITLGEGWHNNHHRYQSSTRNGFYWWEVDPTYYGLKLLSWTGFIWGLKPVPQAVLDEGARAEHAASVAAAESAVQARREHGSSPLKQVIPAAAAIAVATVQAANSEAPRKTESPAVHKDVSELAHELRSGQTSSQTPPTPGA